MSSFCCDFLGNRLGNLVVVDKIDHPLITPPVRQQVQGHIQQGMWLEQKMFFSSISPISECILYKILNIFVKKYFSNLYYIPANVSNFRGHMQVQKHNILLQDAEILHLFHEQIYYSIYYRIYSHNLFLYLGQ